MHAWPVLQGASRTTQAQPAPTATSARAGPRPSSGRTHSGPVNGPTRRGKFPDISQLPLAAWSGPKLQPLLSACRPTFCRQLRLQAGGCRAAPLLLHTVHSMTIDHGEGLVQKFCTPAAPPRPGCCSPSSLPMTPSSVVSPASPGVPSPYSSSSRYGLSGRNLRRKPNVARPLHASSSPALPGVEWLWLLQGAQRCSAAWMCTPFDMHCSAVLGEPYQKESGGAAQSRIAVL